MSSKVSPSPRPYQGPSSIIFSKTSSAEVSGGAVKAQEQFSQYSSTCMGKPSVFLADVTCQVQVFIGKSGTKTGTVALESQIFGHNPSDRKRLRKRFFRVVNAA